MAAGDCDDSRPPAPASREGLLTFRMAIEQARNERRIGPAFEPKKLRLYVSGPMTGLPALNFPAFMAAALQLRGLGFEAINPAELNPDPGKSWAECMRVDIKALMDCEGVALLPGWLDSKGARVEYDLAQTLGMEVRELAGWLLKPEDVFGSPVAGTHRPAAACTSGQACVGAAADSVGRRTKHLPADDTEGGIE